MSPRSTLPAFEPDEATLTARTLAIAEARFVEGAQIWRGGRVTAVLIPVYLAYGVMPVLPGGAAITSVPPALSTVVMGGMVLWAAVCWAVVRRWGVRSPAYTVCSFVEPGWWVLGSCALIASDATAASVYWVDLSTLVVLMATTWFRHHVYRALMTVGLLGIIGLHLWQGRLADALLTVLLGGTLLVMQGLSTVTSRSADRQRARAELVSEAAAEARAAWERERIARELHDGLGAELTSLLWQAARIDDDAATDVRQAVQRSLASLRGILASARSEPVGFERLGADLQRVARLLSAGADVPVEVQVEGHGEVSGPVAADMLRAAQELTRNALTHARATRVSLSLVGGAGRLTLEVRDDGTWRAPSGEGQGLRNVEARAREHGGAMVRHLGDGGTRIELWMVP